ncbi:MAG: twin-arginine translocase TatA/TatE family subunit [Leifsonia sp.]
MFGLTFEKMLIIGVIAVFLLGPERLPHYAAQLGRLVRQLRDMANGAKDRMRDEMGPEFEDVDWKKLDPRQYDPRRIIREALIDDAPASPTIGRSGAAVAGAAAGAATGAATTTSAAEPRGVNPDSAYLKRKRQTALVGPAPFDSEAT